MGGLIGFGLTPREIKQSFGISQMKLSKKLEQRVPKTWPVDWITKDRFSVAWSHFILFKQSASR